MLRQTFGNELQRLCDEVVVLGSMVEQALLASVKVLIQRDERRARAIIEGDLRINEMRFAIEYDTLALIATQQPMAGDLRKLAAVLEVASELERTGDYAKGIAKISISIGDQPLVLRPTDISAMCETACNMLERALCAFVESDVATARALPEEDDIVDELYNRVYHEILALIFEQPSTMDQATLLLWVAHNLERAADRVTNICERVVFTVTGELVEMDVE